MRLTQTADTIATQAVGSEPFGNPATGRPGVVANLHVRRSCNRILTTGSVACPGTRYQNTPHYWPYYSEREQEQASVVGTMFPSI